MTTLIRCKRCQLPETYETIEFDAEGVCNICRSTEHKQTAVDWAARKDLLDQLVAKYRGKSDYDCIVPFSGGKDSTFQLYYLVTEYKLKPLVVRFNHGFMRPVIARNNERTFKKLGVDVLEFTPNWHIVKRVMLEAFRRKTDFCWHCHSGIYSYPLRIATKFNVPLVFWGEPHSEIAAYYDYLNDTIEYEDEKKFNMFRNLGISADDMHGMIDSPEDPVDRRDLLPYTYPALKELKAINYCSICLGSFIPWDYVKNTEIIKRELGWEAEELEGVPNELNTSSEKIECFMQGTRDYIKFLKRGYTRISQISAFHLRNGRLTPEQAEEYRALEGRRPPSLDHFLGYVGLSEEEFNEIVRGTAVPPYEHDYGDVRDAKQTWDYEKWYREENGPPELVMLRRRRADP
jgi:N-acetyl sugar amidotransferase